MKKLYLLSTLIFLFYVNTLQAMSNTAEAITATSAAGLINAGTAIYMKGQGLDPQFVVTPNGTVVIPNSTQNPAPGFSDQNQQSNKQAFFNGDN